MSETKDTALAAMRNLSPRRNTTEAESADQLVAEQLLHFGINPATDYGRALASIRVIDEQSIGSVLSF